MVENNNIFRVHAGHSISDQSRGGYNLLITVLGYQRPAGQSLSRSSSCEFKGALSLPLTVLTIYGSTYI